MGTSDGSATLAQCIRSEAPLLVDFLQYSPMDQLQPYFYTGQGVMSIAQATGYVDSFIATDFFEADMKLERESLEEHCLKSDKAVQKSIKFEINDNFHSEQSALAGIEFFLSKSLAWAKGISGYNNLDVGDQIALLKANWLDMHVFESVLCTMHTSPKHSDCSHGYIRNSKLARGVVSNVAYWFEYLGIDRFELVLLKGILLFNPGKHLNLCMRQIYHTMCLFSPCDLRDSWPHGTNTDQN